MMKDEVKTNGLRFIVHRSYFIVSPLCGPLCPPRLRGESHLAALPYPPTNLTGVSFISVMCGVGVRVGLV
jgi:hypothetical protein